MHACIFASLIAHCVAQVRWDDLPDIPSLGAAMSAYNMLKGSPGVDIDSSASGDLVFDFVYTQRNNYTEDNVMYKVPDGFQVLPENSCEWDNRIISSVDSASELQQYLLQMSGDSSLVGTAAFAVSTLFTTMFSSTTTHNFASWVTRCSTFRVTVSLPNVALSQRFTDAVAQLDTRSDTAMLAFANKFGTDVITHATFGGMSFWQRQLVSDVFSKLTSLQIAAGIRADFFKGKLGVSVDANMADWQLLQSNSVSQIARSIDRPCGPPPSGNPMSTPDPTTTWKPNLRISSSNCQPVLLQPRTTQPITDLLTTAYFPADRYPGIDINKKRVDLTVFLTLRYCTLLGPEALSKCAALHPLAGAVTHFSTPCPQGWIPHKDSTGRIIMAVSSSADSGAHVGEAMEDMTDRSHSHLLTGTATAIERDWVGVEIGGGLSIYDKTTASFTLPNVVHNASSAGLPFLHLNACEFVGATSDKLLDLHLPYDSVLMFANLKRCPKGYWTPFEPEWSNRSIIPADSRLGPYPVSSETAWSPVNRSLSHSHVVTMTTQPHSMQIAFAGGAHRHFGIRPDSVGLEASASGDWNVSHTTLLGCYNTDSSATLTLDAPAGMLLFSAGNACPQGWRVPATWTSDMFGRYVVHPYDLTYINSTFPAGVSPIDPKAKRYQNQHVHSFTASGQLSTTSCVQTTAHDHCCGWDFGDCKPWKYTVTAVHDTASQVPFVHMVICEPNPLLGN